MTISRLSSFLGVGSLILAGAACLTLPVNAGPQSAPVFAELFTSQGCSSCPPADQLWGELQKRPDIVALSFNIDYWDYTGWRDTLASHENTVRQQAYEKAMPSRRMYTPQVIVDGVRDVVGNQRNEVTNAINARLAETKGKRATIVLEQTGDDVLVRIDAGNVPRPVTVWVAHTLSSRSVNITRGENSGKLMTYWNVVRDFSESGKWSGEAATFTVPAFGRNPNELTDGLAVWIQSGSNGPVYGAAQIRVRKAK